MSSGPKAQGLGDGFGFAGLLPSCDGFLTFQYVPPFI